MLALVPPFARAQTRNYAAVVGDFSSGIPQQYFKYMDANEACVAEFGPFMPSSSTCVFIQPGSLRSALGSQPAQPSACFYNWNCLCGDCLVGTPDDPRNLNKIGQTAYNVFGQTLNCLFRDMFGKCIATNEDTPKGKGCPVPLLGKGDPCNIVSGNSYQSETVYRAASGGLELVLSYNSHVGVSYFQSGAFGRQWTSPYFARVRATGQGIVVVERPSGRELEFKVPASGDVMVSDADVTDKLERVLDPTRTILLGLTLTSAHGDRVEQHDGPASQARGAGGTLVRIRDRALVEHTMTYSVTSTPTSVAQMPGLLIAVTDQFGRQLNFTYDAKHRVATMTDPDGGAYAFEYDGPSGPAGANNLTKITYPDGKTRVYFYGEAAHINGGAACASPAAGLLNALTGLQDEKGVRFATWTYNCLGQATSSELAGGTSRHTFTYIPGQRQVTDPLGTSSTVNFTVDRILGVAYGTGTLRPAASGSGHVSDALTYDAQGNVASRTDYNGNRTNYTYDLARNLETSRTEGLTASAATTPQTRIVTTEWHATFRLPTSIAEPLRITRNVYDADGTQCGARGALCSRSIQATTDADGSQAFAATPSGAPRTWTYTYNANGSVLTVDGPRTDVPDVTTYTYYTNNDADPGKRGNVATIANAAGHTTSISAYNAHGQPLTIVDPNGLTTTMTYDARQRLKTRAVGGEITTYDYDFAGQLTKVTLPDGSFLSYSYDEAHRLTGMQDNLGNSIAYTLDAMGNRTQEEVRDPASQIAQTRGRVFNNLNRLFRELGAQSQTTEYAYDDQGNVISVKDPLNRITSNQYDALNRLKQVTDPGSGVTQYGYNGLDALTQVADPRSLVTGYTVDGLGNLTQQASPDTGTTTNTYDVAGNLLTQTDAKNQTTTYTYDALNRITLITFHDGSRQAYAYDQGANGIGRLSAITETDSASQVTGAIVYGYDQHGRVVSETRAVAGVPYLLAYAYDSYGRLSNLTYPSGRTVSYGFDSLGRVSQITTTKNNETEVVVQAVPYHPFGGVKGYTLGNGQVYTRGVDLDGRVVSYTLGNQSFAIGYDAASRISFISDVANPPNANTYGYDNLDRLTSAVLPTTPYAYSYDAVGNRTSRTAGSSTDNYAYGSTSNRIASITPASGPVRGFAFDANGSTTADGRNTYAYDARGRMVRATSTIGTTDYQVNALGQRIRKTNSLGDTVFHYDTQGKLIAETSPFGALRRELIYLGDIPVGVVQ